MKLEELNYVTNLKAHGKEYADKKQLKYYRWQVGRKLEHSPCRFCKTELLCNICSFNERW